MIRVSFAGEHCTFCCSPER